MGLLAWRAFPRVILARRAVFLTAVVAWGWLLAVVLAAQSGGLDAVTAPFERRQDYWVNVPLVESLGPRRFIETYPDLASRLSLHARTHPPGGVLLLWAIARLDGGSVLMASLAVALCGALGAVAVYRIGSILWGEGAGRAGAVLFVGSPGVLLYAATSLDAVFMTVIAAGATALVSAPRSDVAAFTAGAFTWVALCLTFAALTLGILAVGVWALALSRSAVGTLARRALVGIAGLGAGALLTYWLLGLDLPAVFAAAASAHAEDPSRQRPYAYWVVGNVVALLITAGIPQATLFLRQVHRQWRRRAPGLESVLGATVVICTTSGVFLGEVDHIWLFFLPLLAAAAGAACSPEVDGARGPAAGGAAQATVEEVTLYTYW